jgi:hypothetical protein
MDKIVMTLLVLRKPQKNAAYPYAVQIAVPKELSPGKTTPLTSVRLLRKNGSRATAIETMDSYHPMKWRAAAPHEQSQYTLAFKGNPQPWYCLLYSLSTSVFEYRSSGNKDTNNGQYWPEIENLDKEWEAEREMRDKCEETLDAEWNRRVARWGEND